jgi:hypothetical protein
VAKRQRVAETLAAMGMAPLPWRANFLSLDVGCNATPVMTRIAEAGMLREWRDPDREQFIGMTIGRPSETDRALAALRQVLSARSSAKRAQRQKAWPASLARPPQDAEPAMMTLRQRRDKFRGFSRLKPTIAIAE